MAIEDREKHVLTGATGEARDHYQRALDLQRCYIGDPMRATEAAIAAAPGFAMAHILRGWMYLIGTEPAGFVAARESHARAEPLVKTPRERGHLAALGLLANGRFHAAAQALQRVSIDHPRDLMALQMGHHIDFFVGDCRLMRDRIARAMPEWREDEVGYHLLLAMHAFGLEECGDYERAERDGRRAVELEPRDSWAQHAVAHVLEMQGRHRDGIAWMRDDPDRWSRDSLLAIHNWWHASLYYLDLGEIDEVLALYDGPIFGPKPGIALELNDASALLWRLGLRDIDVGQRWAEVADKWAAVGEAGTYAFNDVHAVLAYIGAGQHNRLNATFVQMEHAMENDDDNAVFTREVGLPVARALKAFGDGDYARTAELLRAVIPIAHRFGGSHAQRDLLDLTMIEAAFRAGDAPLARALTAERRATKPTSPFTQSQFRRARQGV
jgi:tetratricopeptide (TPR) repeat protein